MNDDLGDANDRTIRHLYRAMYDLYTDWHHKTLPDGEYPKEIEELVAAYPNIEQTHDIAKRVSQYSKREAVMVRLRPIGA